MVRDRFELNRGRIRAAAWAKDPSTCAENNVRVSLVKRTILSVVVAVVN